MAIKMTLPPPTPRFSKCPLCGGIGPTESHCSKEIWMECSFSDFGTEVHSEPKLPYALFQRVSCKKAEFLPSVRDADWDIMHLCADTLTTSPTLVLMLSRTFWLIFFSTWISVRKRNWGGKGKNSLFSCYKCLRPITVRCVKVLHLQKGLSNSKQGEDIYF